MSTKKSNKKEKAMESLFDYADELNIKYAAIEYNEAYDDEDNLKKDYLKLAYGFELYIEAYPHWINNDPSGTGFMLIGINNSDYRRILDKFNKQ